MRLFYTLFFVALIGFSFSQPSFTIAPSVCDSVQLTVTANSGTVSAIGYTWTCMSSGPVISSPNSSVTSILFANPGMHTITLDIDDGSTVTSTSHTITVFPNPTVSITYFGPICPPPTQIGSWMYGLGATNYTWMPGGYTGANYPGPPTVWQPSSAATFTLFGEDVNGCIDTAAVYVQVNPAPWVVASGPSVVCSGGNDCYTANGSITIYYWTGPCGFSDYNQNPCISLNQGCGGTFTVGGSDNNGCLAITSIGITVSPCTNVEEINSETGIKVFPSPASDFVNIDVPGDSKPVDIEMTDLHGRAVFNGQFSEFPVRLNLSSYPPGIYFVKAMRAGSISESFKVIKG